MCVCRLIKKVQINKCHFSEEHREEMDVENSNGVRKVDTDYNVTNSPDIVTYVTSIRSTLAIGNDHKW